MRKRCAGSFCILAVSSGSCFPVSCVCHVDFVFQFSFKRDFVFQFSFKLHFFCKENTFDLSLVLMFLPGMHMVSYFVYSFLIEFVGPLG